jgi:hypothetical protein
MNPLMMSLKFGLKIGPMTCGMNNPMGLFMRRPPTTAWPPWQAGFVILHSFSNFISDFFVYFSDIAIPEICDILYSTGEAREAHPSRQ